MVPGNSVFLSNEISVLGNILSCIKGVKYRFQFQEGTWDFSRDAAEGKFEYKLGLSAPLLT